jgi:transposase
MALLNLDPRRRKLLEAVSAPTALTSEARRAQALLWLDRGESAQAVAGRLGVSRQTVYNWAVRFRSRSIGNNVVSGLVDAKRSGRPKRVPELIDPVIREVLPRAPREFGLPSSVWNPTSLVRYLERVRRIPVCRASVRLALERVRAERVMTSGSTYSADTVDSAI